MAAFTVVSYNINSIRVRLDSLLAWMHKTNPDVVCLQETKVQDNDFPEQQILSAGYHVIYKGEKSRNGVAIISKHLPNDIQIGHNNWGRDNEARLISAKICNCTIVNTYIPQGQEPNSDYFQYKLDWIAHMQNYFAERFNPSDLVLWVGDFNVAPEPLDIYDPARLLGRVGYHPDEHAALQNVKAWGFLDIFRQHITEGNNYTFWDYRIKNAVDRGLGWRIDHIWGTEPIARHSVNAGIAKDLRRDLRPSDHAPIWATFNLP